MYLKRDCKLPKVSDVTDRYYPGGAGRDINMKLTKRALILGPIGEEETRSKVWPGNPIITEIMI